MIARSLVCLSLGLSLAAPGLATRIGTPRAPVPEPVQDPSQDPAQAVGIEARPAAPPRVLLVVADDIGQGLLERAPTPHLDRLAAEGTTFTRFWATPKCGPTRAALLTGRFHFRVGDGNGEAARQHKNRSLGLDEPYLPRTLGGTDTAAFGKWHLSSSDPRHPNRAGFARFAGTLGNLNGAAYRDWPRVVDGVEETCTEYATTVVTDDAIASRASFEYVAYHAAHTPFHDPPRALAPTAELDGTPEAQVVAMVEALDTELGRLFAAHEDAYIFFLTDNGTTSLVDGGKGTLLEEGIHVPLIVRGPDVPRGATNDALVNVVDLYATICDLRGVDVPPAAEDSVSFVEVLRGGAGRRTWNYACLFREKTPNRRTEAIRNADFKLIYRAEMRRAGRPEPPGARTLYRMPGEVAIPREDWGDAERAAHEELEALRLSLRIER